MAENQTVRQRIIEEFAATERQRQVVESTAARLVDELNELMRQLGRVAADTDEPEGTSERKERV